MDIINNLPSHDTVPGLILYSFVVYIVIFGLSSFCNWFVCKFFDDDEKRRKKIMEKRI